MHLSYGSETDMIELWLPGIYLWAIEFIERNPLRTERITLPSCFVLLVTKNVR